EGNPCTNDFCDGSGACAHPNNSAPCTDGTFCNGADTCAGGSCSSHAGDPCLTGTICDEGSTSCVPCVQPSLPTSQHCIAGRDCTRPISLARNGKAVAQVGGTIDSTPASTCTGACTLGAAAGNGACRVDSGTCDFAVEDATPPITSFSDGEAARVVIQ